MFESYETVTGSDDMRWQVDIELPDGTRLHVRNAEVEISGDRAQVKAYDPLDARDGDGWTLRLFDAAIEGVNDLTMTDCRPVQAPGFIRGVSRVSGNLSRR